MSSSWPEVGDDIYYRRINTQDRYDLGKVISRPTTLDLKHGVWEIETAQGSLVTRKGYELSILSQR